MTDHRALQCFKAARTALIAANTRAADNVEIGRSADLTEDEPDAIDIRFGPDAPVNEFGTDRLDVIDSIQRMYVDLYTRSIEHEERVVDQIYELRSQTHAALLADPTLGLAFVISIRYQGTEDFEPLNAGDRVGAMRTVWDIAYRMDYANPAT